jgi:hypothetical protein
MLFQPMHLLVLFLVFGVLAVVVIPYWLIFKKAGFPAPLALLMPVPLVGVVVLYVVAFSRWKVTPQVAYAPPPPPVI